MTEFTFATIERIYREFLFQGYSIVSFEQYLDKHLDLDKRKVLILRHDVDRFPMQSLKMAQIEHDLGISATYYFRIRKSTLKPSIIMKIRDLGHEIGYHYENLTDCKGDYRKAISDFDANLARLREFYPVKTICMHGSPLSKWDNKLVWKKYDYTDFGIKASTSFDIDYNKFFYITDNGWGWNNRAVSVRDKVDTVYNIPINSSEELIDLLQQDKLPHYVMINAHPDTFFDLGLKWLMNKCMIKGKKHH